MFCLTDVPVSSLRENIQHTAADFNANPLLAGTLPAAFLTAKWTFSLECEQGGKNSTRPRVSTPLSANPAKTVALEGPEQYLM